MLDLRAAAAADHGIHTQGVPPVIDGPATQIFVDLRQRLAVVVQAKPAGRVA